MQSQSSNKLYEVSEAVRMYKVLFGKDLDYFDMLLLLPTILGKTGSIATKQYLLKGKIVNSELELPAGVNKIEYVCSSVPIGDYNMSIGQTNQNLLLNYRVDQSGNLGLYNENATNFSVINPSESVVYEVNKNVFSRPRGFLIPFENDNNCCLKFNYKEMDVDVLYYGTVVDAEGYPKVPNKTIEAIANYMFFIDTRKRFHMKQVDGNMMALATADKNLAIAQARTPDSLSQNEMDQILNVLTSSNKKRHNLQMRK